MPAVLEKVEAAEDEVEKAAGFKVFSGVLALLKVGGGRELAYVFLSLAGLHCGCTSADGGQRRPPARHAAGLQPETLHPKSFQKWQYFKIQNSTVAISKPRNA